MCKPLFLTSCLAMLCLATFAQNISVEDAAEKAVALRRMYEPPTVASPGPGNVSSGPSLVASKQEDNNMLYYVFNYPEGGFAIIGGNEVARDVLGYSSCGSFKEDNLPDGLKDMLLSYEEQISRAIEQGMTVSSANSNPPANRISISPLIQTKWDQDAPYSDAIPGLSGYMPFVTGCGATAAAQIMKYYNYPLHGKGSNSYTINYNGTMPTTFSVDFASATYDWGNMLNEYKTGEYSIVQANAVATLMYHVGVAMNMLYGDAFSGGSSSYTTAGAMALTTYFGYDKGATMEHRDIYTDEQWENLIYNELKQGHPVFYSGQSADGGHAFICHGYDASSDRFCINWGWSGACDGYFPLTGTKAGTNALTPNGSGIGGGASGSSYTGDQTAFIGLVPDKGTPDYEPQWLLQSTWAFPGGLYNYVLDRNSQSETFLQMLTSRNLFYYGYMDMIETSKNTSYGVIIEDVNTGRTYSSSNMTLQTSLAPCSGVYRVYPAARLSNDPKWHKMYLPLNTTIPTLTIINGFGDKNQDGKVSASDLPGFLKAGNLTDITKLINILLQK